MADELEHVAAVVTLDAGESNDLHPHDKKTIADRVFNVAMDFVYGQQAQPQPVVETAEADDGSVEDALRVAEFPGRTDAIAESPSDDVGW